MAKSINATGMFNNMESIENQGEQLPGQQDLVKDYPDAVPNAAATEQKETPKPAKRTRKRKADPKDLTPDTEGQKQDSGKEAEQKEEHKTDLNGDPEPKDPEPAATNKGLLKSFYVHPDEYKRYKALSKTCDITFSKFVGEAVRRYAAELEAGLSERDHVFYEHWLSKDK